MRLRDAELLLDDSLSAVDAKTRQAIIDTRSKKNEMTEDDHHCFSSACLLSIRRIMIHRLGSRSYCRRRPELVIYWLQEGWVLRTIPAATKTENKMKVFKQNYYQSRFINCLSCWLCTLTHTIFSELSPLLLQRWSMGLYWPLTHGGGQRWLASNGDSISWSWASDSLVSYLNRILLHGSNRSDG